MTKTKKAFTLIEILVGLSIFSAIFIIATSLVVNVFSATTKGRQLESLEQTKNDLQTELGNTIRWADSLSFVNGNLTIDDVVYSVQDGKLLRDNQALTSDEVVITKFNVTNYVVQTGASVLNSGTGVSGQYFNNQNFTDLAYTQTDYGINFNWIEGSPGSLVDPNSFSVRFTGQVEVPTAAEYTFYASADDGARLWIDNTLLVDDWDIPGFGERSGRVALSPGKHDLRLDYFESAGSARVALFWSYPGVSKQIIPTSRLYPRSGPGSVEVLIEMQHKNSISLVESLKLILSPRGGNVTTIE